MMSVAQTIESGLYHLYDEMQNELKKLCASPDLNWYKFEDIDFFQMVVGDEFPVEENGIELYRENELYVIITERPEHRPSEIINRTIEVVSSIIKELI